MEIVIWVPFAFAGLSSDRGLFECLSCLTALKTGVRLRAGSLEVACREQISYLWVTGWQGPDHRHPCVDSTKVIVRL